MLKGLASTVSALESTPIEVMIIKGLQPHKAFQIGLANPRPAMQRRAAEMEPSEKSRQTSRSQNSFALLTTSYFSTAASFVKDDFNLEQMVIPALRDRIAGHRSSGWERFEKDRRIAMR